MNLLFKSLYSQIRSLYKHKLFISILTTTMIVGLITHGYQFTNLSASHDGFNCLVMNESHIAYKNELGRFSQAINYYFRSFISAPWLVGLLSLFWIAIANYMIVDIFSIKSKILRILISGLTVTNLSITITASSYIHEIDMFSLSFLCTVCSVYFIINRNILLNCLAPIILCIGIGFYQAYISVAVSLSLIWVITELLKKKQWSILFSTIIKMCIFYIAGLLLYAIVYKITKSLYGIDNFVSSNIHAIDQLVSFQYYITNIYHLTAGSTKFFFKHHLDVTTTVHGLVPILNIIMALTSIFLFIGITIKQKLCSKYIVLICVLSTFLPLSMNLIFFITHGQIHVLMIFSFVLAQIFGIILLDLYLNKTQVCVPCDTHVLNRKPPFANALAFMMLFSIILYIFVHIVFANNHYLNKQLTYQNMQSQMTRLEYDIDQVTDGNLNNYNFVIVGSLSINENYSERSNFRNNYFKSISSLTYADVFRKYFALISLRKINFASKEICELYEKNTTVQKMPSFPCRGYIKKINQDIVIKLSNF